MSTLNQKIKDCEGTRGDFFRVGMNDEIECPDCKGELSLVKEISKIKIIKD